MNTYTLTQPQLDDLLNPVTDWGSMDKLLRSLKPNEQEPQAEALAQACGRYEAALMAAFPQGAHGEAFEQWNEARKALAKRDDKAANVKGAQR